MTAVLTAPGIFESFNAKHLEPEQVAQTFVPPRQFQRLSQRVHTLIVGPRGSGKTTLLKMLQPAALEAWDAEESADYRSTMDYTGVFIPTDLLFGRQLGSLGFGELSAQELRLFGVAAFTAHVLRSLILAMEYRVQQGKPATLAEFRRASLSRENEATLVSELARAWGLHPSLPSLPSLRHSLSRRLSDIRELASSEATRGPTGREGRLAECHFLHFHFLQAAGLAIEVFDDLCGEGSAKWAMLFDELELAPRWITEELIRSLRSANDRFLFKLAMSPFSDEEGAFETQLSAVVGQDFESLPLWYAHKDDGYPFCRQLLCKMLAERGLSDVDPNRLFGRSEFETTSDEWAKEGTAYSQGSRLHKRLARMAGLDRTFREYLNHRGIDLRDPNTITSAERAATLRKVAPLVAVRETFRSGDQERRFQHTRSRKNPTLYAGAHSLFAMLEGNPRWFIGVVTPLLDGLRADEPRVEASAQTREIGRAVHRFRALLRTIPCPVLPSGHQSRGALTLLGDIGSAFYKAVVLDDFTADPVGSFIVDSSTGPELLEALGQALNAGAIVFVPDRGSELLLRSLRGKRFRLSYLLAPMFQIPIRLGPARSLSSILTAGESLSLFREGEE